MHWDDAAHSLTIGAREGSFPGMLEKRTFRVVLVSQAHGNGIQASEAAEKTVTYTGKMISVKP
jgi:alpha-D-xyloside xylohydrolase